MRKAQITFLREVTKNGRVFAISSTYHGCTVHYIGMKGGFERYPADSTMEGSLDPCVIVELPDGTLHYFELHYDVSVTFEQNI